MKESAPSQDLSFFFEVGRETSFFGEKFRRFRQDHPRSRAFTAVRPGEKPENGDFFSKLGLEVLEAENSVELSQKLDTPWIAYLPALCAYSQIPASIPTDVESVRPWFPFLTLSPDSGARASFEEVGWTASVDLFKNALPIPLPGFKALSQIFEHQGRSLKSSSLSRLEKGRPHPDAVFSAGSRILALVPHFNCNDLLRQALQALTAQTRPLDGIAVLDDNSAVLPQDIVREFPNVTLLRSRTNVGPYQLIQTMIDRTDFDGYLFQDADDWCACDRLEKLLEEAERTGAELIGSHELMFFQGSLNANYYPLDVHSALSKGPSYALLHPSSLVSRRLATLLGGYATGLRFSGDLEFLNRAFHAARITNLDAFSYFRRMRAGSLTLNPRTGLGTPAREALHHRIRTRAADNLDQRAKGLPVDLRPLEKGEPIELEWVMGPTLGRFNGQK